MIPITKPLMGEPEAEAARRVILSGWTSQGPEVAAFEAEFAALVGAPHALGSKRRRLASVVDGRVVCHPRL